MANLLLSWTVSMLVLGGCYLVGTIQPAPAGLFALAAGLLALKL